MMMSGDVVEYKELKKLDVDSFLVKLERHFEKQELDGSRRNISRVPGKRR